MWDALYCGALIVVMTFILVLLALVLKVYASRQVIEQQLWFFSNYSIWTVDNLVGIVWLVLFSIWFSFWAFQQMDHLSMWEHIFHHRCSRQERWQGRHCYMDLLWTCSSSWWTAVVRNFSSKLYGLFLISSWRSIKYI